MSMNSSLNIGRKWDFEQLEAWYTALLNPGGKHKYYDAELHYLTVKSFDLTPGNSSTGK